MTKRLIDAAQAVSEAYTPVDVSTVAGGPAVYTCPWISELQAALDEARQPVTVTPDQAVEILAIMLSTFGEPATQAEVDALSTEDKQEIVGVVAAILQKARELGL